MKRDLGPSKRKRDQRARERDGLICIRNVVVSRTIADQSLWLINHRIIAECGRYVTSIDALTKYVASLGPVLKGEQTRKLDKLSDRVSCAKAKLADLYAMEQKLIQQQRRKEARERREAVNASERFADLISAAVDRYEKVIPFPSRRVKRAGQVRPA